MCTMDENDTRRFISLVKAYPVLWQRSHPDFLKSKGKSDILNKIAEEMGYTGAFCKNKLNNLKGTMKDKLEKLPKTESGEPDCTHFTNIIHWPFFKDMLFMKADLSRRQAHDADQGPIQDLEHDDSDASVDISSRSPDRHVMFKVDTESGQDAFTSSHQAASTSSQRSSTSSKQVATSSKQVATSSKQVATSSKQAATSSKQAATSSKQAATSSQKVITISQCDTPVVKVERLPYAEVTERSVEPEEKKRRQSQISEHESEVKEEWYDFFKVLFNHVKGITDRSQVLEIQEKILSATKESVNVSRK